MADVKKREIKYEIIRVIAMIFVITIHQLDKFKPQFTNPTQHQLLSIVFLTCNGLFFMLSGKFSLNFNYEEKGCYKKYYFGKFIKIIIPALFYMAIKQLYLMHFTFNEKITITSFFRSYTLSVVEGYIVTEYWFVYYLISNLLVAPFIARIFRKMTDKEFYLFFAIALLSNALSVYAQWVGHVFAVPFYLSGMNIYFFLGYFIDKISSTKKQKRVFFILGVISYVVTFICLQLGKTTNIFDVAPTMTFVVCMFYILFRDGIKIKKMEKTVLLLGRYSFSIYLLHVIMMDVMTWIFPYNEGIPISVYVIIKVIMILISSLTVAILIDNTIIKLLKKVAIKTEKIIETRLRKNRKRKMLVEGRRIVNDREKEIV